MTKQLAILALALGSGSAALADITKPPDIGLWWHPVGANGSYVYADSFIADEDCTISDLGTWLDDQGSGGSSVRFEVWGDNGGPDPFNVISSTGSVSPQVGAGLAYNQYSASAGNLVNGTKYWFAITGVGEAGPGGWYTGGHTQNSVYNDNGTFWFSNDPSGISFDGQNLTPEVAFSVICRVPAPGSAALLGLGGLVAARRRRA